MPIFAHSMPVPIDTLWKEAVALAKAGKLAEAEGVCRRILAEAPHSVHVRRLAANLSLQLAKPQSALQDLRAAIAIEPANGELLLQAATVLRSLGRDSEAIPLLEEALARCHGHAETQHQLGNALRKLGRHAEALAQLQEAVRGSPDSATIWLNLGVTLLELDRHAEAVAAFERALQIEPERPEALNVLGTALLALGEIGRAQTAFSEALRIKPDHAPAIDNLARSYRAQGRIAEAIPLFRRAIELRPDSASHSNLLLALNYSASVTEEERMREHLTWADRLRITPLPRKIPPPLSTLGRRLRIGYVSPDFCQHSVSFFIEPVLQFHDRSRFEVFCYHNGHSSDATTLRLQSRAEHWAGIASLNDDALVKRILADGIDVLVDLAGHTAGNRLAVFAKRPAPVQLTWIGYPNTTGLRTIDYRLTDAICVPPGAVDEGGSEKILRLPEVFCCYAPPAQRPEVHPEPSGMQRAERGITFCSFNHLAKISDGTIDAWGRILASTRGSRLLLKSPGAGDHDTQSRFHALFAARGISPDRIQFNGERLSIGSHLALYNRCGVALDTFPYNGTTTTCEALLMGMPVVALAGVGHAARVGASLLTTVGLKQLVADDEAGYVDAAVALAEDPERLAILRTSIRDRLLSSPLCNAPRFTAHYERTLVAAFEGLS